MTALGLALLAHGPMAEAQGEHKPSAADMETARTLYQEGRQLREQGNIAGALEKFKAAHALAGTPVTGVHLAQTHAALGQLVEARETCLRILRMPVQVDETERSVEARKEAAQLARDLEPRIPSVIIRVEGVEAGVTPTLTIDGQALPSAAIGLGRKVNPGSHAVKASAYGYYETSEQLSVREGETKELTLTLRRMPPGEVPPPETSPPDGSGTTVIQGSSGMSPVAVTGFIVAGTGAAIGTISGLLAMQKASDLEGACTNNQCPPEAHSDVDSGRMFGTVSTVAFGVAVVGLAVGIWGVATQDEEPEKKRQAGVSPWLGLGSVGVGGVF
jgi:hypothetical protein